jgi:two-component system chemotaxis sensor kinase CheA
VSNAEQEMLDLFVQEATEHLAVLETDLLALEGGAHTPDLLNRLFRAVHSVKGTAGFFGLGAITELAHVMESVMALLRDGRMHADRATIDTFLSTTDKLKVMVADPGRSQEISATTEYAALQAMLRSEPAAAPAAPELPVYLRGFTIDAELVRHALKHGHNLYVVQIRLAHDIEIKGHNLLNYFREVASLGTLVDTVTDHGAVSLLDEEPSELVCSILFATAMEADLLLGAFDLPAEQLVQAPTPLLSEWLKAQPSLAPAKPAAPTQPPPAMPPSASAPAPAAIRPPAAPAASSQATPAPASPPAAPAAAAPAAPAAPAPAAPAAASPAAPRARAEETVRISVATLDALMNLAGEMVLGRNQLLRFATGGRGQGPAAEGLASVVQGISGVTSDLQRTVMRARLQPVGGLFGKFTRVVRDLGQKLSKEIHLEIIGDEVELDRALIEGLSDPLTHLVRNSADHGIEPPEERRRLGKPAAGRLRISAAHLAGRVQIEVRDDGRGLDPARLKAKAVEKGLLTAEQAARLADPEAWQLIFAPGFSTAAVLSDVSGRGVGMDVVKTNIERLGGRVELQSVLGQGTGVIIRLPLTLAIIPALIVSCANRRFAVPQLNLEEIVRPSPERPLEDIGGARVLRLRDELIPVLDLPTLLGVPAMSGAGYILVLRLDRRRFGLHVEEVSDTEEIVVKPLGRHFQGIASYSGATLLGQGEVALILDPAGLAAGRLPPETETARGQNVDHHAPTAERVLLFRDGGIETFALHVANIGRIEKVPASRVERIGGHDYLRQANGPTLRLIRLTEHLPVAPGAPLPPELHVIVPRLVGQALGIIAPTIIDAVDLPAGALDTTTLKAPGVLGTASLRDQLTLVLDLYSLLTLAGFADAGPPPVALTKLRVLLAEDTAFFREAVRRALVGEVASLEIARDGEEAWERLQTGTYDILVTDLEMPRLNGFELTERIRADERFRRLPVVALSARDSDEFHERARVAGIDLYETKLDRDRLRRALLQLTSTKRSA